MFNPLANMMQTMQQLQQFTQNYQGNNPQGDVQQLLNSGKMSQDQLNRIMPLAQQIYQMMGGRRM